MTMTRVTGIAAAMLAASPTVSIAQGAPPAEPRVLADGNDAKYGRVENTHKVRFIEIFLAGREAKSGKLVAACFNTIFTRDGIPASRDTAPQERVQGLDFDKMKKDYGVLGASLNGPKLWLPDWTEIDAGVVREFNGIKKFERISRTHENLVDLLHIQKEIHSGLFAIMDGTTAGNGPGPRTMYPVVKNVMLASADQVAIDAVAASMMGFDPMSLEFISVADEHGLGNGRRENTWPSSSRWTAS